MPTASAAGDKESYRDHPLFIDLDFDPIFLNDNEDFVVMQEGAVILQAENEMTIEPSEAGDQYALRNPSQAALAILPGTPVAFVNKSEYKAFFFVPTQVQHGTDCITFLCNPTETSLEELFQDFSLSYTFSSFFYTSVFGFNPDLTLQFTGDLSGQTHLSVTLTPEGTTVMQCCGR